MNGPMTGQDEWAIAWLLSSDEPAIRALVRHDLLDEEVDPVTGGPRADVLLRHGTAGHPYRKWTGVHWRLISLAELGIDPTVERVRELTDLVLTWLSRVTYPENEALPRRHASIEGNALAACCRLGRRNDPRAARLAGLLETWQWPDAGRARAVDGHRSTRPWHRCGDCTSSVGWRLPSGPRNCSWSIGSSRAATG